MILVSISIALINSDYITFVCISKLKFRHDDFAEFKEIKNHKG